MDEITAFAREVVAKLIIGDAVLKLLRHVIEDESLAVELEQHRGASYQRQISFSHLTHLLCDTLISPDGSLDYLLRTWQRDGKAVATRQAYYGKLRRMPVEVSRAFFLHAAKRLGELHVPSAKEAMVLPSCFDGLEVRLLDGKELKHVAKRLVATRKSPGSLLGGMLLVGWDPRSQLVDMVAMTRDGEANECTLVEDCVAPLARHPGKYLLVLDQQFGDLTQPARIAAVGQHYLIRRHPKTHFHPDLQGETKTVTDAKGRTIRDEVGQLGSSEKAIRVRHLTIERPGESSICVFTDLLDRSAYSALDLLDLYAHRWDIEGLFQQATETFGLSKFIGTSPEAVIFQSMLCLLMANVTYVVQGQLAATKEKTARDLSTKKLMREVRGDLTALFRTVSLEQIDTLVTFEPNPQQLREWLTTRLVGAWDDYYLKAVVKTKRLPRKKTKEAGAHRSVQRLIDAHQAKTQRKNDP